MNDVTSSSVANDNTSPWSVSSMTSRDVQPSVCWVWLMSDCTAAETLTLHVGLCSIECCLVRSSVTTSVQFRLGLLSAAVTAMDCRLAIDSNGLLFSWPVTARTRLANVVCRWLESSCKQSRRHSPGGSSVACWSSRLLASIRRRRLVARWLNRPAYSSGEMATFCDWRQSVTSRVHASNPSTYCAALKALSVSPVTTVSVTD